MHCIHVHFCEEWCGCCNSQWDDDLLGLSDLAEVAHMHIPGYISAHKWPPISLCNKHVRCIEATVSRVVVCCYHCINSLLDIQYLLMCALWIAFPQCVIVQKEAGSVVDDERVFVVCYVVRSLEAVKPVVRHFQPFISLHCCFRVWDLSVLERVIFSIGVHNVSRALCSLFLHECPE